jgi:hypothetical protein
MQNSIERVADDAAEWDGICVCGKAAADGVRCRFGATHAARPVQVLPLLPYISLPALPY